MSTEDAIVESLASAAREDGIHVGVSEGVLTVPTIGDVFALVQFAAEDGWHVDDDVLRCQHGELDFQVPVIVQRH